MLEIDIKNPGAELTSIKFNGKEMLHDGKTFWDRQAPILFPTVGRLTNNKTIINNKEYEIPQHGFAKDMNFKKIEDKSNYKKYLLKSNEETLKKYPFEFELTIEYFIEENTLTAVYTVKNDDNKEMIFGIGGHPGFKIDNSKEYYFELEKEEINPEFMEVERKFYFNKTCKKLTRKKQDNKNKRRQFYK